ncbi:MAG: autotransporter-associated beta strand repeat-containing protein [Kiritimatiellia bacterium]
MCESFPGPAVFRGQNNIAATARVYQSGSSQMQFQYVGDVTVGCLGGSGGTIVLGPSGGTGTTVLHVGSNNESSEYYGGIWDSNTSQGRRGALVKEGSGVFALNGSTNNFTGSVTVNEGVLLVNGNLVGGVAAQVTVNSGATLGGCGVIRRLVTVNSGGTLAPGNDGVGTLTVVGNLTFASGTTNRFELGSGAASDKVEVTGNLTFAAASTLVIDAKDGFGEGVYTLFTYTGALTWNAPEVVAPENYKGVLSHTGTTGSSEVRLTVRRLKGSMLLIR